MQTRTILSFLSFVLTTILIGSCTSDEENNEVENETEPNSISVGEIKSFTVVDAKYVNEGTEKIRFHTVVKGSVLPQEGTTEWGVYVYHPETKVKYDFYPSKNPTFIEDNISICFDINKDDFDKIVKTDYYAIKGVDLGVYIKTRLSNGLESNTYSEIKNYSLVYDEKPQVKTGEVFDIGDTSVNIEVTFEDYKFWNGTAGVTYNIPCLGCDTLIIDNKEEGKSVCKITDLKPGTTYFYNAFVECNGTYIKGDDMKFKTIMLLTMPENMEWVDLGLPSGIKWASCNVGAKNPEDYGAYFAWGETSPKDFYSESNSIAYNKHLGEFTGNAKYDAATANWGFPARMPTGNDCYELVNECTWNITQLNGEYGMLVTGPNGNTIFLPAAQGRQDAGITGDPISGFYWSSSPSWTENLAFGIQFKSDEFVYDGEYWCAHGFSVRPVSD